jgi:hypothetical protein
MIGKPRPQPPKPNDILARHSFPRGPAYRCRRCERMQAEILAGALACISEDRARGNAAIGRITAR